MILSLLPTQPDLFVSILCFFSFYLIRFIFNVVCLPLLILLIGIHYYHLNFIKDYTEHFVYTVGCGHPSSSVSTGPRPPRLYPPSRARIHARRSLGNTRTNMAASVSPLRSSFRICSPLTFPRHCCRAKLRMHRKCESQRRHVHQTATR